MDRDDALAAVVSAALIRYTTQLAECRAVLGDAVGRSRSQHERPPDLRHAGHLLARDRRRLAERAVDEVWKGLGADLEQLVTALAAATADEPPTQVEKRHYPLATEQVFAAVLAGVGPLRIQTRVMELLTACGNDAPTVRYAIRYAEWVHRDTQSTITSIVLPAAVSDFEEVFAALLRLWLTLYPRALGADKKEFDAGTVASYASTDDIMRMAVDKRVDEILAERPEDWQRVVQDGLKLDLRDLINQWPQLVEVVARRNAYVHAGGRVDRRYLDRLPPALPKPELGVLLASDTAYLTAALDLLEFGGITVAIAWLGHFAPSSPGLAQVAELYVFRALQAQCWIEAVQMATIALKGRGPDHELHELRVNLWMARRELDDDWPGLRSEIAAWTPPPDDPRYHLAKAALLLDERAVLTTLREAAGRGDPLPLEVADWPLLTRMAEASPAIAAMLRSASTRSGRSSATPTVRGRRPRRR